MGDICPSCGDALPEDTPCPCTADYYHLADDEEWIRILLDAEVGPPVRYDAPPGDSSSQAECSGECLAHRGHIYILCYGRPVLVRKRDHLRDDPSKNYPISHYVGWTGQRPPIKRVKEHGARSAHYIAQIRPGTMRDEEHAKRFETCPRCGKSLCYYAESPTYSEEYANNPAPGQGALLRASERRKARPGPRLGGQQHRPCTDAGPGPRRQTAETAVIRAPTPSRVYRSPRQRLLVPTRQTRHSPRSATSRA